MKLGDIDDRVGQTVFIYFFKESCNNISNSKYITFLGNREKLSTIYTKSNYDCPTNDYNDSIKEQCIACQQNPERIHSGKGQKASV